MTRSLTNLSCLSVSANCLRLFVMVYVTSISVSFVESSLISEEALATSPSKGSTPAVNLYSTISFFFFHLNLFYGDVHIMNIIQSFNRVIFDFKLTFQSLVSITFYRSNSFSRLNLFINRSHSNIMTAPCYQIFVRFRINMVFV